MELMDEVQHVGTHTRVCIQAHAHTQTCNEHPCIHRDDVHMCIRTHAGMHLQPFKESRPQVDSDNTGEERPGVPHPPRKAPTGLAPSGAHSQQKDALL